VELSSDLLRTRFRGTELPDDPSSVELPDGSDDWPASLKDELSTGLKPAGVLIPVLARRDGLTVLFTRRSAELKTHAGQVSFPGGRMEADDPDIAATALRETHEEVGIPPERIEVLGHMRPLPTVTGYAMTPTIGLIAGDVEFRIDTGEVAAVFEVPLNYLAEPGRFRRTDRDIRGRVLPIIEVDYADERIWGATAYMLLKFIKALKNSD